MSYGDDGDSKGFAGESRTRSRGRDLRAVTCGRDKLTTLFLVASQQGLYVTRFFGGIMASSPVTIVGGGLSDLFDQKER